MEWNYIKGLLNDEAKQYAREACRRVKAKGGVIHSFMLGRTLVTARSPAVPNVLKPRAKSNGRFNMWSPACSMAASSARWNT